RIEPDPSSCGRPASGLESTRRWPAYSLPPCSALPPKPPPCAEHPLLEGFVVPRFLRCAGIATAGSPAIGGPGRSDRDYRGHCPEFVGASRARLRDPSAEFGGPGEARSPATR